MVSNFSNFYNYLQIDNTALVGSSYFFYCPEFEINFSVSSTSKLQLLQTFELLYQFFKVRPSVRVTKQLGKVTKFNIKLTIRGHVNFNLFRTIYRIRSSSKCKLIRFTFNRSGQLFIVFNDFTTLFPFEIKFYDFHTWRNLVSMHSKSNSTLCSTPNNSYVIANFFHIFFKDIYYGQVQSD
jgi:hypothetical protein